MPVSPGFFPSRRAASEASLVFLMVTRAQQNAVSAPLSKLAHLFLTKEHSRGLIPGQYRGPLLGKFPPVLRYK